MKNVKHVILFLLEVPALFLSKYVMMFEMTSLECRHNQWYVDTANFIGLQEPVPQAMVMLKPIRPWW